MAKIKPFRAFTYNQDEVKDLSKVVCPPYDVISPSSQQYFQEISLYNLIHILLGKDIPGENKYKRSAGYFKDWLKNKIIIQDDRPAIYFYNQQYNLKGERRSRFGFIALLSLDSSIFKHEHTRLEPKADRLKLLKAVKANLSPIFVIFSDRSRIIQRTFQQEIQNKKPFIDIVDIDKVAHQVWRINSPELLKAIEASMLKENIFIADGHHRYEVSCAYRDEMKKKSGALSGEESFNYLLAYFTNLDPRGLTIFPIHRLLKLGSPLELGELRVKLSAYFDVEEVKDKNKFFFLMEKGGQAEHVLGMYKDSRYWLLRLKNVKILDKIIADKPREYRLLDVCILNHLILKNILGIELGDKERLTFSPHADELIDSVDNNASHIAFFLNPVKAEKIISIALENERMPAKSTYFYPKVLSGLVINKFNEDKG